MNERIKTLAKVFGYDEISQCIFIMMGFDMEKFAQLIVRECIQVSEAHAKNIESQCQSTDSYLEAYEDGIVNGIYEATETIKQHFGIEE